MTTLSASVHEWSAGRRASGFVQVGIAPGISIRPIPPVKRRSGPKRWPGSHGGRRCPHLGLRLLPDRRSQHIVSADSITYASDPPPGIAADRRRRTGDGQAAVLRLRRDRVSVMKAKCCPSMGN